MEYKRSDLFYAAMRRHHSALAGDELRVALRTALGLRQDAIVLMHGGHPYMLGGRPKVIGKCLLAEHIRARFGCEVVEVTSTTDAVMTDREIGRIGVRGDRESIGLSRGKMKRLARETTIGAFLLADEEMREITDQIKVNYRERPVHPLIPALIQELSTCPAGTDLGAFNNRALEFFRRQVGLSGNPRDIGDAEQLLACAGGLAYALALEEGNHSSLAPFWVIIGGVRYPVMAEAESFSWAGERGDLADLIASLRQGSIKVAFRVASRVLLWSVVTDGHITGGGARSSAYNAAASETAGSFGIQHFPSMHPGGWWGTEAETALTETRCKGEFGTIDLLRKGGGWDLFCERVRTELDKEVFESQ